MPISSNTVIFKFRLIFATDERSIVSGKAFHYGVFWKPIDPCFFCCHGSMGFPKTSYRRLFPRHNSSLIGRKNQAKFENDCILRNGPGIKVTQPNIMILVSFSSAEDALSNVKK